MIPPKVKFKLFPEAAYGRHSPFDAGKFQKHPDEEFSYAKLCYRKLGVVKIIDGDIDRAVRRAKSLFGLHIKTFQTAKYVVAYTL